MKFDFCPTVTSRPHFCTDRDFTSLIYAPRTADLISRYRHGEKAAKRRLPAFCFHATFGGQARKAEFATPSGLVMLDFDHLTPDELKRLEQAAIPATPDDEAISPVLLVHVTPSGSGLRVVFRAERTGEFASCRSIADFQGVMSRRLGFADRFDAVTDDLARCSFCPGPDDVCYFSKRLFTDEPLVTDFALSGHSAGAEVALVEGPVAAPAEVTAVRPAPSEQDRYHGFRLTDIFQRYFLLSGGLPEVGARNSAFYRAARDLRYICDFNPQVLAAHMPDVGLPPAEVFSVCRSACDSSRGSVMPQQLERVLRAMTDEASATVTATDALSVRPTALTDGSRALPRLVRELVLTQPDDFRPAALLGLLPVLGTLSTHVRARYLDGELHSPSFMTVISAGQASGKSFMRRIVQLLTASLAAEDAIARKVERQYRAALRFLKSNEKPPREPRIKIRLVPASISVAKLLQRLDSAEGEHLFSFVEELDTISKSNKAGAWSEKGDIYRNAFDNALYGQDYISDASYSAVLPVYYNLLALGTPKQVRHFFSNVENGLVSRVCFASIPDQFGARMPCVQPLPEVLKRHLDEYVKTLREARGTQPLEFVNDALSLWLEQQRTLALKSNDRARDVFRRRSAVIGFRAALCVCPLYYIRRSDSRQLLADFALLVADLTLSGQLQFAGDLLNCQTETETRTASATETLFDHLPDTFSHIDVERELALRGMRSPGRQVIWRWKREKWIEKTSDGNYKKITDHGTAH